MNNGQKQKNIVVVYTSLKVNMKMQNAINHILNRNVASHKVPIVVKNANSPTNSYNYAMKSCTKPFCWNKDVFRKILKNNRMGFKGIKKLTVNITKNVSIISFVHRILSIAKCIDDKSYYYLLLCDI